MIWANAYRAATRLSNPILERHLKARLARGKEDGARLNERFGIASAPRPEGFLIWCHAASVGETQSVLPLLQALSLRPANILLTTGTRSSAQLAAARLPSGAIHQYVPLDHPDYVRRFLDHWRPRIGLFVETELWPNLIFTAQRAGTRLALINARFSERSARGWRWMRPLLRQMLECFELRLAQDAASAERLRKLTGLVVSVSGNLKFDAPALPDDAAARAALQTAIGDRPVWLAASTQKGEEALLAPVVAALERRLPNLLTMIAPRHPERGAEVAALFNGSARRSQGALPGPEVPVYVADTLGELGVFYRLSPIVFLGGSLVEHGGQNPVEPARLGAAATIGPHHWNQADAVAALNLPVIPDAAALTALLERWLCDREALAAARKEIAARAIELDSVLPRVLHALDPLFNDPQSA